MEAELLRAWIRRAETVAHDARPETPRRAILRDLLEKIVVRVEEKREPLPELVHVEPGIDRRLNVRLRIRERERDLLHRGRSGFADVIAANRDRVPVRQLALTERKDVGDDAERCWRRKNVRAAGDVLLEDVVLHRARQRARRDPLPPGNGDVERQQNDRRRIDRH